jgi:hypothetical protein
MSWFIQNLILYIQIHISYLQAPIYLYCFWVFDYVDNLYIFLSLIDLNLIFFTVIIFMFFLTFVFDFYFLVYLPKKNTTSLLNLFYFYFKNILFNKVNYFFSFFNNKRFFKLFINCTWALTGLIPRKSKFNS